MEREAGARPAPSEGDANAPAPATPLEEWEWAMPTHFYYLAATMLLIEVAIGLWIVGLIRPLGIPGL